MNTLKLRATATAISCACLAFTASIIAEESPGKGLSIQQLMSPEEYLAAGLNKLTPEEIEALNAWLSRQELAKRPVSASPQASPEAPLVMEASVATTGAIAGGAEEAATPQMDGFGFPEPSPAEKDRGKQLQANVLPPFKGWSGKTIFRLDNGQVWQQRVSGRYTYSGDDTLVAISGNRFGFYEMELVAAKRSVGVKRLK